MRNKGLGFGVRSVCRGEQGFDFCGLLDFIGFPSQSFSVKDLNLGHMRTCC